jgi:hypothetical protein
VASDSQGRNGDRGSGGGDRWVGVGRSTRPGSEAGAEAAAEALRGPDPQLLILFCSDAYDLPELLAGVNRESGGAPLIGCSTAGEIASSGARDSSVVVTALGGPGFAAKTSVTRDASSELRQAGADVAGSIWELDDRKHKVLLMLTDGLAGDQSEIVRGVYSVTGAGIPLVGGCAGDDMKMEATYQLHGDEVLRDAVVAAAIGSDDPIGIGVRHGWRRVGEPMMVTDSSGNRVFSLDDRPALDVYLERLNPPSEVWSDPAAFTNFAQTHPLGLDRESSEDQVRFVGDADFEDRSLGCIAEVPAGGLAWLMEGDDQSVLGATDDACRDALQDLDGSRPLGMVAFDCIARRGVLDDQGVRAEVERIAQHASGAPVAGFYTYGEFARTRGVTGFHNQTLVVLALS